MKFIYVMRNPIDRLVSQYTYSYARWTEDSLEERINHGHIVAVSRYAHQLDQYFEKFGQDNFLLLDFDDLRNKPENVLKRICVFLHIDSNFGFSGLSEVYNKSKGRVITRTIDTVYKKYPLTKSFSKLFPKSFKGYLSKLMFHKRISELYKGD